MEEREESSETAETAAADCDLEGGGRGGGGHGQTLWELREGGAWKLCVGKRLKNVL